MKLNHAIDLSAAVENAAEITHLSESNVTQCAKNCDVRPCDFVASSAPVTQCVKSCDVVTLCDDGNPPVTQCEKLCSLVSEAAYNCDIRPK